jgi:hypothetical protein
MQMAIELLAALICFFVSEPRPNLGLDTDFGLG